MRYTPRPAKNIIDAWKTGIENRLYGQAIIDEYSKELAQHKLRRSKGRKRG